MGRRGMIIGGGVVLLLLGLAVIPSPSTSVGAWLYEILRRCPEPRPELADGGEFLVIGHRGAAAREAENTITSMERAMRLGANALETDLCMTADSQIVLWHDWDPGSTVAIARQEGAEPDVLCAPYVPEDSSQFYGTTDQLTLQELRSHYGYRLKDSTEAPVEATIPTLDDFMEWSSTQSDLNTVFFDLKLPESDTLLAPAYIALIRSIIETHQPSFKVIFLVAGEAAHRNIDPLLPESNLSYDAEPPAGIVLRPARFGSVDRALRTGNSVASHIIPIASTFAPWTTVRRIIEEDMEKKMASNGGITTVMAGTTNDPEQWDCLLGLGIDGIITDVPGELRGVVGR